MIILEILSIVEFLKSLSENIKNRKSIPVLIFKQSPKVTVIRDF